MVSALGTTLSGLMSELLDLVRFFYFFFIFHFRLVVVGSGAVSSGMGVWMLCSGYDDERSTVSGGHLRVIHLEFESRGFEWQTARSFMALVFFLMILSILWLFC